MLKNEWRWYLNNNVESIDQDTAVESSFFYLKNHIWLSFIATHGKQKLLEKFQIKKIICFFQYFSSLL